MLEHVRLSRIAKDECPNLPFILLGHGMGSFASQQYVLDHSREIDGLILSGSGALDGLARVASSAPAGTNILNAPFEPIGLVDSRYSGCRCVHERPALLCATPAASFASFLGAAPRLGDPGNLRRIRADLPMHVFSGSEDPGPLARVS